VKDREEAAHQRHVSRVPKGRSRRVRRHDEIEAEHPHESRCLPKVDERWLRPLPSADLGSGRAERIGHSRLAESGRQSSGARIGAERSHDSIPTASAHVDEALLGRHATSLADGLLRPGYRRIAVVRGQHLSI